MWSNRYVRTVIISRVLLQLGIWIRNFAILLYVTDLTNNDPQYVSLISVAEFAPIFLFALIGGTFADKWRPKRTMVWCDLLSALSIILVLAVLTFGSWYALLLGTLISASLSQFSQPSASKLFKQHVPADQLQGVMAIFQSLNAGFMVIGPIFGAFIYQQYGIEVSLILTGVMFLGSALVLSSLPRDRSAVNATGTGSFKEDLMEGLRYMWANRTLRTVGTTFAVAGLGAGLIQPMFLFIAIENLGQDSQFLQWLLMVTGAAMFVGGGVILSMANKIKPHVLLAIGLLSSTICTIGLGWSTSIVLTFGLQIVNGFFTPCIHVGIQTMIMQNTEAAFIGRVGGTITPIFMGMMVVGMSSAGYLKAASSLSTVFTLSGILFLLGMLLLLPLFEKKRKSEISC